MSDGRVVRSAEMPLDEDVVLAPEEIDLVVEDMVARRNAGEPIDPSEFRQLAQGTGCKVDTVRGWVRNGGRSRGKPGPKPWTPPRDVMVAVASKEGRIATAHEEARLRGAPGLKSVKTWQRHIPELLGPFSEAYLAGGEEAGRKAELTVKQHVDTRNLLWGIDFIYLRRYVAIPRHPKQLFVAWAVVVVELHSRAVAGWTVVACRKRSDDEPGEAPTSADVMHALAEAMRRDPVRGPAHGRPRELRHDNDPALNAEVVTRAFAHPLLRVKLAAIDPYTPRQNGGAERFFGTLRGLLASPLNIGTRPELGGAPRHEPEEIAVPLWTIIAEVDTKIRAHNRGPHPEIPGMSRSEVWEHADGAIRPVPNPILWRYLRRYPGVQITEKGVRLENEFFVAKELADPRRRGATVELRYRDIDSSAVEVFWAGQHLCTAYNTRSVPEQQLDRIWGARGADRKYARALVAEAEELALAEARAARRRDDQTSAGGSVSPTSPRANPWGIDGPRRGR